MSDEGNLCAPFERWRLIDRHTIEVDVTLDEQDAQILPTPLTAATPLIGMEEGNDAFARYEHRRADQHGLSLRVRTPDEGTAPDSAPGSHDFPVSAIAQPPCACW